MRNALGMQKECSELVYTSVIKSVCYWIVSAASVVLYASYIESESGRLSLMT